MAWALIGALCLALEVYVFSSWILSGKAKQTPHGPTPIPTWMKAAVISWETLMVVGLIVLLYLCVIRPRRREGHLTWDGLFILALLTIYWQDPMLNYTQVWSVQKSYLLNWGSWSTNIPGWLAPHANLYPEGILGVLPSYGVAIFTFVAISTLVMRKAKARWPTMGKFGLGVVAYGVAFVADIILEPLIVMPLGIWEYPGAIRWLTLFHGKYYQFPIYEAVFGAFFFAGFTCVRYFKNDRGQSIAERGIEELRISERKKTGLRFLSLVGICNVVFLVGYNIPIQFFALHADPWPQDLVKRSYLSNGLCGPGTAKWVEEHARDGEYACPGPTVPIPRPDSVHLTPEGRLHVPTGS